MKASMRIFFLVPCMMLMLGAPTVSHATTFSVSGQVWENGTTTNVPVLGSSIFGTTPTATFTVTNPSAADLFNFFNSTDIGLSSFLTTDPNGHSNGDTLTYQSGSSAANDSINDDLFQFTGTTTLTNGVYTFAHDDGLILYLNGSTAINAGGPTSAETTDFTVCPSCAFTAGTYSFTLDYAEVDGPPAELVTDLPLTGPPVAATPEPGSIFLLGTGLLAAAGAVRRRMIA